MLTVNELQSVGSFNACVYDGGTSSASIMHHGKDFLWAVELESNEEPLLATHDHLFLVQEADAYVFRSVKQLGPGSLLCTNLPKAAPEEDCPDETICKNLQYWLGVVIGDKVTSTMSFVLNSGLAKRERTPDFIRAFYVFALEQGWHPRNPNNYPTAEPLHNMPSGTGINRYYTLLEKNGLTSNLQIKGDRLPKLVRKGCCNAKAFIYGLLEGSAIKSANKTFYTITMNNEKIARELVVLCRFIGIEAKVKLLPGDNWHLSLHPYDVENVLYPMRLSVRRKMRVSRNQHAPKSASDLVVQDIAQSDLNRASLTALYRRLRSGGTTHAWMIREMYRDAGCAERPLYNTIGVTRVIRHDNVTSPIYSVLVKHQMQQYVTAGFISKGT
jgi:hypothetical protein